jgi:integrase
VLSDYIAKKGIRSKKTAETYEYALKVWARSLGVADADAGVQKIKDGKLDPYQALQGFVNYLSKKGSAPKTILTYHGALKGFLLDSDVELTENKLRAKIVLPQKYEISTDRAPTREEVRSILLRSKLPTKAAIAVLASSGLRLGELRGLKVSSIVFGKEGRPSKILLKAAATKSRRRRITFISPEATELLKEFLGPEIKNPDRIIYPQSNDTLYNRIMRSVERTGLKSKSDSDSARYELHPHCLRKYFFSNCLAAGLDRGLVEGFMGHKFALDSAYLRINDEELADEYSKAVDRLTFLTSEATAAVRDRMQRLELENKEQKARLDRLEAISVERLMLAAGTKKQASKKRKKE